MSLGAFCYLPAMVTGRFHPTAKSRLAAHHTRFAAPTSTAMATSISRHQQPMPLFRYFTETEMERSARLSTSEPISIQMELRPSI